MLCTVFTQYYADQINKSYCSSCRLKIGLADQLTPLPNLKFKERAAEQSNHSMWTPPLTGQAEHRSALASAELVARVAHVGTNLQLCFLATDVLCRLESTDAAYGRRKPT